MNLGPSSGHSLDKAVNGWRSLTTTQREQYAVEGRPTGMPHLVPIKKPEKIETGKMKQIGQSGSYTIFDVKGTPTTSANL